MFRIRRRTLARLTTIVLLSIVPLRAQSSSGPASPTQQANQNRAHALLAATIQALGGPAYFQQRTAHMQVRSPQFFQGSPTGKILIGTITSEPPDKSRLDVHKLHYVQLFCGDDAWEITYKGMSRLPQRDIDSVRRLRKHSLFVVLSKWYDNPGTALIDEGPSEFERHPTEKIKIINPANEAVALEIDMENHLPLRLSFAWRDPSSHDKTLETTEYDNYHTVDGIATAFTTTESQNGEIIGENFVQKVKYNVTIPPDFFNPDVIAAHLKK